MPLKTRLGMFFPVDKSLGNLTNGLGHKKPFVSIGFYDSSSYTALKFLEAVRLQQIDNAMAYISKNFMDRIDLGSLSLEFSGGVRLCSHLVYEKSVDNAPKNCSSNTFMLVDNVGKNARIFHIHMINEPDHLGKWKVYNVEQE
jgi:hypothetical protein